MAARLTWSPDALADIESISDHIAKDSEIYARAVVRRVIDSTRYLSRFPESGRVVPEFGEPSFREVFVYSYRILYRLVSSDEIMIVNVIHGKRSLKN